MKHKCLYCYKSIQDGMDFHEKCSQSFFGVSIPPKIEYSLDQMDELAKSFVERSISVPGVQAKLSMSIVRDIQNKSDVRLTVVGALGGQYIFKPPNQNFPEMPENESISMRIAEIFGLRVVPHSLIRLASGELAYITKRIDRSINGQKIHMIDMFQITEAYDKYRGSMEMIGKSIGYYSENTLLDKLFFFELTLFSFLIGNNDMHLKNFSMMEGQSGWVLSPAYDLLNVCIVNPSDTEELALTLVGKKKKLKREHFVSLGTGLDLTQKQIDATFSRFSKRKSNAIAELNRSFLSIEMKARYVDVFGKRYAQIGLS